MKKFNRIWMWMAIAAASFSFTSCDDDYYWHDDYYWYDDYNHGGWENGIRATGTTVLTALRMITCCRRLRLLQATGEAL